MKTPTQPLIVRHFDTIEYQKTWENMRDFTDHRSNDTPDELWLLEHPPVFTQGLAGKAEHILNPHSISVVQTDRGGQVTYHGPGQLVAYALFDLKRQQLHARELVRKLENSVIDVLLTIAISAQSRCDAPGVYVQDEKICSIGLRVRKYCSYHGIALNVDMDLTPFSYINPCGYEGMKMTQIKAFSPTVTIKKTKQLLVEAVMKNFGYNSTKFEK